MKTQVQSRVDKRRFLNMKPLEDTDPAEQAGNGDARLGPGVAYAKCAKDSGHYLIEKCFSISRSVPNHELIPATCLCQAFAKTKHRFQLMHRNHRDRVF